MIDASIAATEDKIRLRKQVLGVILRNTLRSTGIPSTWLAAETKTITTPAGSVLIELALEVTCEEPRFFAYLGSFQAEFMRRLGLFEDTAPGWFGGITWKLQDRTLFELPMPSRDYWEEVDRDRALTARLQQAIDWDARTLEGHFEQTAPAPLVAETRRKEHAPREVENLIGIAARSDFTSSAHPPSSTFTVRRRDFN